MEYEVTLKDIYYNHDNVLEWCNSNCMDGIVKGKEVNSLFFFLCLTNNKIFLIPVKAKIHKVDKFKKLWEWLLPDPTPMDDYRNIPSLLELTSNYDILERNEKPVPLGESCFILTGTRIGLTKLGKNRNCRVKGKIQEKNKKSSSPKRKRSRINHENQDQMINTPNQFQMINIPTMEQNINFTQSHYRKCVVQFLDTYNETAEEGFSVPHQEVVRVPIIPKELRIDRHGGSPKWKDWRQAIDNHFAPTQGYQPSYHFAGFSHLSLWIYLGMRCKKVCHWTVSNLYNHQWDDWNVHQQQGFVLDYVLNTHKTDPIGGDGPVMIFINPVGIDLTVTNKLSIQQCLYGKEPVAIESLNPVNKGWKMTKEEFPQYKLELDLFFRTIVEKYSPTSSLLIATTGPIQVAFLLGTHNVLNPTKREIIILDYVDYKYQVAIRMMEKCNNDTLGGFEEGGDNIDTLGFFEEGGGNNDTLGFFDEGGERFLVESELLLEQSQLF